MRPLAVLLLALLSAPAAAAPPPDYTPWQDLLAKHYDPARGMRYKALKAQDKPALDRLRQQMAQVDPAALAPKDRLAYWINLYNISVVGIVVDHYPVDSIRDISTDPIIRLNVFKKDTVATKSGKVSLDTIENVNIREAFKDPRIHFAINCAAKSCPPIRTEAFTGEALDAQLDAQARAFLDGPHGARFQRDGETLVITTTKIMDWFGDDFDKWGGGKAAFIRRYVPADKQRMIDTAKKIKIEYDDYDWGLNDWKR